MTTRSAARDPLVLALSPAGFVLFWQGLAWLRADPRILPGPALVAASIWAEAVKGALWHHVSATLLRVIAAFTLAMLIGGVLGAVLGRSRWLDRWADPWVLVFLNIPALVVIVLCYLWIGLNEVAAITAGSPEKAALGLVTGGGGARGGDP